MPFDNLENKSSLIRSIGIIMNLVIQNIYWIESLDLFEDYFVQDIKLAVSKS